MSEDKVKRHYHYGYNKVYDIERITRRKKDNMPRIGMNPLREERLTVKLPPALPVVAIITHQPNEEGYHAERFEIVKAAVMSAKRNAGIDAHFVVWDNGSHYDLQDWLSDLHLDRLILSENVGKMNAISALCNMYSGSVIAISDDDILHYDNWLAPQLELLRIADYVSGCTTRYYMKYQHLKGYHYLVFGNDSPYDAATEEVSTPLEWDLQHGASIGKDERNAKDIHRMVRPRMLHKDGISGLVGGNHCQFVARADMLRLFFKQTDMYMQPLYPVDIEIDRMDYVRLLTPERKTRHLGNVLSDADRKEINDLVESF